MSDIFLSIISQGDKQRFKNNSPSTFTTRLSQVLYCPEGSRIGVHEVSFLSDHKTEKKHVKLDILDWLWDNQDNTFGRIFSLDLGSFDLPNPQALADQLNFHIGKLVSRLRDNKIFAFDSNTGRITFKFGDKPLFYTLRLSKSLMVMIGQLEPSNTEKPGAFCIIGADKPAGKYRYEGGERQFAPSCSERWASVETHGNYFEFSPHLSVYTELSLYSDLIAPQPVNNDNFPLMRVFPLPTTPGRKVITFGSSLQLIKLKSTRISEFTIYIRDLFGGEARLRDYTRVTLIIRPPDRSLWAS